MSTQIFQACTAFTAEQLEQGSMIYFWLINVYFFVRFWRTAGQKLEWQSCRAWVEKRDNWPRVKKPVPPLNLDHQKKMRYFHERMDTTVRIVAMSSQDGKTLKEFTISALILQLSWAGLRCALCESVGHVSQLEGGRVRQCKRNCDFAVIAFNSRFCWPSCQSILTSIPVFYLWELG